MPEKYQKEIEEILKNAGEDAPDRSAVDRESPPDDRTGFQQQTRTPAEVPFTARGYSVRTRRLTLSPRWVLLSGLAIFVIGAWVQPGFLMWLGLALIGVGYLLDYRLPRSKRIEPRWRGRPAGPDASTWDRIKRRKND